MKTVFAAATPSLLAQQQKPGRQHTPKDPKSISTTIRLSSTLRTIKQHTAEHAADHGALGK
jgi:hypothetical protein